MPKNPSLEERIAWHREHQKHCSCRPIPAKVLAMMKPALKKVALRKRVK